MRLHALYPLLMLLATIPAAGQATWIVQAGAPAGGNGSILAPFASVQAGLTAATGGDTVLVGPGTYLEDVDFLGKAVTLRSSAGPAVTTLQGTGTGPPRELPRRPVRPPLTLEVVDRSHAGWGFIGAPGFRTTTR